jgi:hypothetical protein
MSELLTREDLEVLDRIRIKLYHARLRQELSRFPVPKKRKGELPSARKKRVVAVRANAEKLAKERARHYARRMVINARVQMIRERKNPNSRPTVPRREREKATRRR